MFVGIAGGIVFGLAGGIASGIAVLRAYYHPLHLLFVLPAPKAAWYPYHPVAWDNLCLLPFPALHRLLVAYAEQYAAAGKAEIQRLIDEYPSQRMSGLKARATLVARRCGRETALTRLPALAAELPEGDRGFLAQTKVIRDFVGEIANLQMRLDATTRPFFREPLARALRAEIEAFQSRVAGLREPLAWEFRQAAANWLKIADRQWDEAKSVAGKARTPQVFRAGDPVDRNQEAFVERAGVIGELEGQIMLAAGCPGIILYGRRRMGKSSALRNLAPFLPSRVLVVTESLQNPQAFTSLEGFVSRIVSRIREECPHPTLPAEPRLDLGGLFDWLSRLDDVLDEQSKRLLLALDEYEQIDAKIGAGVFTEDLLATLRESVQTHRRITWILAGSHDITELKHAPWPSYLVSLRMIEVPPFTPEETRLLLTNPLRHSSLWHADDPNRPRFNSEFWNDGGIERIQAEAAGWPHLVQLIAETAVDLVNDSTADHVTRELMERALDKAIVRGEAVLRLLMQTESELPGEWQYLLGFRRRETQPPPADEAIYTSLRRRLLVEPDGNDWRLRVPLMHRWLRTRA